MLKSNRRRHGTRAVRHALLLKHSMTRQAMRCCRATRGAAHLLEVEAQLLERLHDSARGAGGVHLGPLVRLYHLEPVPSEGARKLLRHQLHGGLESDHLQVPPGQLLKSKLNLKLKLLRPQWQACDLWQAV